MSLVTFRVEFREEPPLKRRLKRIQWQRVHGGTADDA